jgi:formate dehydrogenase major subunit
MGMSVSRRDFFKLSGSGLAAATLGFSLAPIEAKAEDLQILYARETTTICPYCAVGCGIIVHTLGGEVINTEGDPDHPINEGALCPKGSSVYQLRHNPARLTTPRYRAAGATEWKDVSWEWTIEEIAKRVKKTRDTTFQATSKIKIKEKVGDAEVEKEIEATVNRTMGIASVGSAALDNEECYLYQKFLRGLGLVYIEHQARICHSSTVPALAESFGRGAMTNHWIDIKNADVILIMGANPAENHPISFRWVTKAKEAGAKVIVVDPRFTRSASKADVYAPLRSGTDIAFLGGMINYIVQNNLYFEEYVVNYTNAAFLVNADFKMPGDLNGLFSGYDAKKRSYDTKSWSFQKNADGTAKKDTTMKDPNSVFQLLKKHYSRYTPELVSKITGTPKDKLVEIYKLYGSTGKPDRAGTEMYAMGWTQHTVGVQNIRSMAIIQLLLGNIGVAGGGINALRGEGNVQGSTDQGLLFHILPGYLAVPSADLKDLPSYIKKYTPETKDPQSANWWQNRGKYMTSYLKAIYGSKATKENDFGYQWLPKLDPGMNGSWLMIFDNMAKNKYKGFFAWGQNPACSGANTNKVRHALAKLDWMVTVNIFDNETASFWKGPDLDPGKIKTEVFLLPAAISYEKEGSISNSGRWAQWRNKAVNPLGQAKPDAEIIHELFQRLKAMYAKEGGALPEQLINLTWNYGFKRADGTMKSIDVHAIAKEINGYYLEDVENKPKPGAPPPKPLIPGTKSLLGKKGELIAGFANLQADGTTSCGNWIYCQSYNEKGNMMARRGKKDPSGIGLFPEWSWAWPVNRRILYNRASTNMEGKPYNLKKAVVYWDPSAVQPTGALGAWVGDVPDGPWPPMADLKAGKKPFIMQTDGVASIFGPGLKDGPFPEHYEPLECPIQENLMSKQLSNPAMKIFKDAAVPEDVFAATDARFPYIGTTYRVTEHWQTGVMTRNTPWLLELQPRQFCELSVELGKEKGIKNGDIVEISSLRGKIEAVAIVTLRMKPFKIGEHTVHEIGMPWCFGWHTPGVGDSANLLTPTAGDANTMIPETKAFMVGIARKG